VSQLLEVENLCIDFRMAGGTVRAVDGLSFRVPPGKTVALVGESGSGKSVTAQAIMGILPKVASISGGAIRFYDPEANGKVIDIAQLAPNGSELRNLRGGRIAIIFQEPMTSLSPVHTIGNQIGEALELHRKVSKSVARAQTIKMLSLVGFPTPEQAVDSYPFELSGGLRQRAMIAMALVCRPALLIADEPTTALDVTIQAQILKLLRDLQQHFHMAVLMITHDLGVVANVADEVVVLYHGKLMEAGPVEEIFRNPSHPYLKALLHAVPRFHMEPGERLVPLREVEASSGTLLTARKPLPGPEPILSVRNLSKSYGQRKSGWFGKSGSERVVAVRDLSFSIAPGECLGLVGESGCGKSTTSKMIMRAVTPDTGEIKLRTENGTIDVLAAGNDEMLKMRRQLQYIFQDPFSALNPRMTVFDIVSEPLVIHKIGTPAERRAYVMELMQRVGLDPRFLNRYPHSFSGGQRQRIGIARALALRPQVLICDEPVSALDVSVQAQILNLLKDLQRELGLTYLFISHNLAVVDYMADRIAVMCAGRLVELASREALFRNPMHPYTQALLTAVPEPSLDHPLDFARVMDERASIPAVWPAPFTDADGTANLEEVEPNHFVRRTRQTAAA
jgi:peptide/nickel transport system ATP-binding protein